MLRLDYLSCFLTILATILVGRKSWTGLLISIVNSSIVCLIGLRTSQFGFIPANLFCICVYAFNIRSWFKKSNTPRITGPSIPFVIVEPRRPTDLSLPRDGRSHWSDKTQTRRVDNERHAAPLCKPASLSGLTVPDHNSDLSPRRHYILM
jgi:hypothetical protein